MTTRVIPESTTQARYNRMLADAQAFVLANTGQALDLSDADGASLFLEVAAGYINEVVNEADAEVRRNLPSETSPLLRDMVVLLGITPEANETNASLWARRNQALLEASLGSTVALRELMSIQAGVLDSNFVETATGDFNVYLTSTNAPPTGESQGMPDDTLNTAISTLLNDGKRAHQGKTFTVSDPTAIDYGIFATVYYRAGEAADTTAFQAAVAEELQRFVRASRVLNSAISLSNLRLGENDITGIVRVTAGMYAGGITTGAGVQTLGPAGSDPEQSFYTCADTVNVVTAQSAATMHQINVLYSAVT